MEPTSFGTDHSQHVAPSLATEPTVEPPQVGSELQSARSFADRRATRQSEVEATSEQVAKARELIRDAQEVVAQRNQRVGESSNVANASTYKSKEMSPEEPHTHSDKDGNPTRTETRYTLEALNGGLVLNIDENQETRVHGAVRASHRKVLKTTIIVAADGRVAVDKVQREEDDMTRSGGQRTPEPVVTETDLVHSPENGVPFTARHEEEVRKAFEAFTI